MNRDLLIIFRDTLDELDHPDLISKKLSDMHFSIRITGLDTEGKDYVAIIFHFEDEYAIINTDLLITFRVTLHKLDDPNLNS